MTKYYVSKTMNNYISAIKINFLTKEWICKESTSSALHNLNDKTLSFVYIFASIGEIIELTEQHFNLIDCFKIYSFLPLRLLHIFGRSQNYNKILLEYGFTELEIYMS